LSGQLNQKNGTTSKLKRKNILAQFFFDWI
jgi:hypothetical protein